MSRVLVVDDDKALAIALGIRLKSAGFEVEVCHSAHDAAGVALRSRPDLITLDIDMPAYTGPELHHCLRFSERARCIPVIYLTGHDTPGNRNLSIEHGAAAYLVKPYDAVELIRTIRAILTGTPVNA